MATPLWPLSRSASVASSSPSAVQPRIARRTSSVLSDRPLAWRCGDSGTLRRRSASKKGDETILATRRRRANRARGLGLLRRFGRRVGSANGAGTRINSHGRRAACLPGQSDIRGVVNVVVVASGTTPDGDKVVRRSKTDADGRFRMDLPEGRYRIRTPVYPYVSVSVVVKSEVSVRTRLTIVVA